MTNSFFYRENCPACQSKQRKIKFYSTLDSSKASSKDYVGTNTGYGKYHDMYECLSCHVLYMSPIDDALDQLCAEVVDEDYLASWEERALMFQEHLDEIKKYVTKGRLLDVGCYAGIFLNEAKKQNFDVVGIEPSTWAAEYARSKVGCLVYQGTLEKHELPKGEFDIVTIWDVIEHLFDPKLSIEKAYDALKIGGHIAITTHDIHSVFARVLGKNYPWLMRFHLVHFSPLTLANLLRSVGFEIKDIIFYKKALSVNYFLKRIGIQTPLNSFTRKRLAFNTGDMFMVIAEKQK